MDINIDHLRKLLDQLKHLSLFGRIFNWTPVRAGIVDASTDLQRLVTTLSFQNEQMSRLESKVALVEKEYELKQHAFAAAEQNASIVAIRFADANIKHEQLVTEHATEVSTGKNKETKIADLNASLALLAEKNELTLRENKRVSAELAAQTENVNSLSARKRELETDADILNNELRSLRTTYAILRDEHTRMSENETSLRHQHEKGMSALTQLYQRIESERAKEIEVKNLAEIDRLKNLKETWNRHEEHAKAVVRSLCNRHSIEYVDKVPFRGDPDNTLMICNEYVVFDAKSPGGDNLNNFAGYLRDQAEKAKKYAKQENVKTDIFFIVPTNALDHLQTFVYKHSDHNVYIISVDALEPVILSLKKVEEYEFADQLSPEDRENICRVLGRFAHLSKRRIQVDSFFARQFIELAYKCESDLPSDILESMIGFEKTGKLNPPMEKRAKSIPLPEIENEIQKIRNDATGRGIIVEDEAMADLLNGMPLHKGDL